MKGKINGNHGSINISEDVIAAIAGSAAVECFGIVGMAAIGIRDGLVRLLKKESLSKGIQVLVGNDSGLTLRLHVIVAFGVNISAVTENLIENVRYRVEEYTGLSVDSIEVFVESVRPID